MKSKGFTLLETLIVIALFSGVTGLIWGMIHTTRLAQMRGAVLSDELIETTRVLDEAVRLFQGMTTNFTIVLNPTRCEFSIRHGEKFTRVSIENTGGNRCLIRYDAPDGKETRRKLFSGTLAIRFFDGNTWHETWNSPEVPHQVFLQWHPGSRGSVVMKPFQLKLVLPQGGFLGSSGEREQVEHE